jgi:hypothetical protein
LLDELAFDPTFDNKHGLIYTIFSHAYQKRILSFNSLQGSNFHVDKKVIQEMKRLTKFPNWKSLIPRLKNIVTHMLSFKILTLICYTNIIKMFNMIINLQISHISHIQGTRLGETSHFDNTKYNHIYVFVNCCT